MDGVNVLCLISGLATLIMGFVNPVFFFISIGFFACVLID